MSDVNLVMVSGEVTGGLQQLSTRGGQKFTEVFIRSVQKFRDRKTGEPGKVEQTIICTAWGELAERCCLELEVGDVVLLQGKVSAKEQQGRQGGTYTITNILLREFSILVETGRRASTRAPAGTAAAEDGPPGDPPEEDAPVDDLPF